MKKTLAALFLPIAGIVSGPALADTTDVKTQSTVVVSKKGAHCVDDPNCMNRYHYAIKPIARAKPGQLIVFHARDALDSNLTVN